MGGKSVYYPHNYSFFVILFLILAAVAGPAFIPPIVAAITAIVLAPGAPLAIAYVSGVLGTLIGADLLNLHRITKLGAPVASIGGAGTFDGVFLSGIIAVIIAAL
jgi:uncharacterized membrane protein